MPINSQDVKPDNILVSEDGRAKVCDYGLARPFCSLDSAAASDLQGGSSLYAPPERFGSAAGDLFSLGCVIAEVWGGFTTAMERALLLNALRNASRPASMPWANEDPCAADINAGARPTTPPRSLRCTNLSAMPQQLGKPAAELVWRMTEPNPSMRPALEEVARVAAVHGGSGEAPIFDQEHLGFG